MHATTRIRQLFRIGIVLARAARLVGLSAAVICQRIEQCRQAQIIAAEPTGLSVVDVGFDAAAAHMAQIEEAFTGVTAAELLSRPAAPR